MNVAATVELNNCFRAISVRQVVESPGILRQKRSYSAILKDSRSKMTATVISDTRFAALHTDPVSNNEIWHFVWYFIDGL
jgi:hypothetical protein